MTRFATYVPDELAERWEEQADEMGMSVSEWIQAMVEAGRKKFSRDVQPDETRDDLRRKRNDLREELGHARDRIEVLEEQVYTSERTAVIEYLEKNPGAGYRDILQYIINTASSRVVRLLDQMEGSDIEVDEDGQMFKK